MPCIISTENWLYLQLALSGIFLTLTVVSTFIFFFLPKFQEAACVVGPISAILSALMLLPVYNNYDNLSIYHSSPDSVYCEQTKVRFK